MTGIIYRAYHQAKGEAFTYIRDVREAAGLSDEQFDQVLVELAGAGTVELLQGFEGWDSEGNGAGAYTDAEGNSFLGLSWVKSPDAFECLWAYREEITEIMGNHPKKEAVSLIAAIPGLNHLKTNTIKSNITPIPFLLGEFREHFLGDSEEREKETEALRAELASLKADLEKERVLGEKSLGDLGEREEEAETLRAEVASLKADLEKERALGEKFLGDLGERGKETEALKAEIASLKADLERGKVLGNSGGNSLGKKQDSGDDVQAQIKALKAEMAEIRRRLSPESRSADSDENKSGAFAVTGGSGAEPPTNFRGWTVTLKKKASGAYYEMVRKIDGKFRFLYIGKKWDEAKAVRKIQEFDAKQTL